MKITICGSMSSAHIMLKAKNFLEKKGHTVFIPEKIEEFISQSNTKKKLDENREEGAQRKISYNLIKKHYQEILKADAILVTNIQKIT